MSPDADAAREDAADGEPAEVVAVVEVRDQQLEHAVGRARRGGDVVDQGLEEGPQVVAGAVGLRLRDARLGVRVEHGEVELVLGGVEVDEEVVDLVQDLAGPRVRAVDLVDHDHRGQPRLERLAQHVAGLGQRPLGGVDEQQDAVHHLERALHLAPEVGVARGVHDVDLGVAVVDRGVLGEDRDAALALEVVRVHDALAVLLVGAEDAALLEQGVDEGGLAVVDVGDDGDVAEVQAGTGEGAGEAAGGGSAQPATR